MGIVFYEPNKYTIHAEKSCIINCTRKNKLKHCRMIVVKIIYGKPCISTCCNQCTQLINKYNIKIKCV